MKKYILTFLLFLGFLICQSFAQYERVQDHPSVKRYKGSEVVGFEKVEFDEFYFPLGDVISKNKLNKALFVKMKEF